MAADSPRKAAFMAVVHNHLATIGSSNWRVVLDQFPEIPEATMWRWIKTARERDIPRPELVNAKAKLVQKVKKIVNDRTVEARVNGTEDIAKHLPAAPSPNYIARSGETGMQNLDVVIEIQKLYGDAKMLRAFGITERTNEATGEVSEHIKNPAAFDKSIVRRAQLLETMIATVQQVWDLRTMQNFYETVIEEIGRESPEAQKRIMARLAELNGKVGMTMSMRI